jgi:hypothetical protein
MFGMNKLAHKGLSQPKVHKWEFYKKKFEPALQIKNTNNNVEILSILYVSVQAMTLKTAFLHCSRKLVKAEIN